MMQFLKTPFHFPEKKWTALVLIITCAIAMLLLVQLSILTWGATEISYVQIVQIVVGYAVIVAICASVGIYCFSMKTVGKFLLVTVLTVTAVWLLSSVFDFFISYESFTYFDSLRCLFDKTYLKGTIIIILLYLFAKNQHLHSNLQETEKEKRKLIYRAQKEGITDCKLITLHSNSKDSLTLFPQELLYMESSGNYVQIYYTAGNGVRQKALRTTLSKMEETLSDCPFFARCHRAFIVNTCQIEKINGLKLWLKYTKTEIPISKTYKNNLQKNR